ncbi:MAG: tail assembly protein [Nitrospirales bacterium]|nr:MAG: tail assembly protein [Nitrospirales bacterium]
MNSLLCGNPAFDWNHWAGLPYAPRGRGPHAYDCWGLLVAVLQAAGHDLPCVLDDGAATSEQQARLAQWKPIPPGHSPQPFDMAAFCYIKDTLHLGLVCGPGLFLHAAGGMASRIDNFVYQRWRSRLRGFYRYGGLAHD